MQCISAVMHEQGMNAFMFCHRRSNPSVGWASTPSQALHDLSLSAVDHVVANRTHDIVAWIAAMSLGSQVNIVQTMRSFVESEMLVTPRQAFFQASAGILLLYNGSHSVIGQGTCLIDASHMRPSVQ